MTARLVVSGLCVDAGRRAAPILQDVSLALVAGEWLTVVGESGCGKTTLGLALLGHTRPGLVVRAGSVVVDGVDLGDLDDAGLRSIRATQVSYVAQHPDVALNPARRVGTQLLAILRAHGLERHTREGHDRVRDALDAVALPATDDLLRRYPHQLSGGQLQRLALAIALVGDPAVLVLDEPTSGLDAATRQRVLATIRDGSRRRGRAVVCITHDLADVAQLSDRVAIMYAGAVVEQGATAALLAEPAHPYTRHLLAAVPDPAVPRRMVGLAGHAPDPTDRPPGCQFAPRCELVEERCRRAFPAPVEIDGSRTVRCVLPFSVPASLRARPSPPGPSPGPVGVLLALHEVTASFGGVDVVSDVDLALAPGEWLALIGPSGSGKTTLARAVAGLHPQRRGRIELDGVALAPAVRRRTVAQRRAIQMVLQHPRSAFNPRRAIGASIARPLRLAGTARSDAQDEVAAALARVGLTSDLMSRFPHQLAGGELQRAAIARALAVHPALIVCDEATASLDAIAQASIIELLAALRVELGLAMIFITHDLALVGSTADRVVTMAAGRLGPARAAANTAVSTEPARP